MKSLSKLFLLLASAVTIFTACDKADDLPQFASAIAPVLAASSTNVAPAPADSNKVAMTLTWTYPNHSAADPNSLKYIIEIDSAGKNFTNPFTKTITGALSTSYTGKELNNMLVSRGYAFNQAVDMDIRVISSFANNNERTTSEILRVKMTPYKIPPKVALPTTGKLFLVGSATQGGWNNPVPTPSQEFARLSETMFAGVFQLNGGQEYLMLPANGDWSNKYSVADKSKAGLSAGGDFGYNLSDNFPGPATSGFYKIVVDFQTGKFTVTPYNSVLPDNLFIVGNATAGGWNNPVPTPDQQFTRLNSSEFEITINLVGGNEYLLLPENGSWSHKYAVADKSITDLWKGGSFGYDLNDNFPGPPTTGNYKIKINFVTNNFSVTKL